MNNLLTIIILIVFLSACATPLPNDRNERTVFVTEASFESNMGGLAGADAKCQSEADDPASIVPTGTYLPWLSDGTESPDTRFTKSTYAYILPDGTKIAEDYTDLTDGSILHAINIEATGAPVAGPQRYWTDTLPDGTFVQPFVANVQLNSCNAWNGSAVYWAGAIVGSTDSTSDGWSNRYQSGCKYLGRERYRLACFQQ